MSHNQTQCQNYNIVLRSNNDKTIDEQIYYSGLTKDEAEEIEVMTNYKLEDEYPFYFQAMPNTYVLNRINKPKTNQHESNGQFRPINTDRNNSNTAFRSVISNNVR